MTKEIIHLDCTLRDGGYYNDWDFEDDLVEKYLYAINIADIDYVEIGFRFFHNIGFKGPYAYCKEDFLNKLNIPEGLKISVMINAEDFFMGDKLIIERLDYLFPVKCELSKINLIRIACNFDKFKKIIPIFQRLKEKGYMTGVNIMQISSLNINEINDISLLASKAMVDVFYFADSLGSLDPDGVINILESIKNNWLGDVGFHAHDNKGLALRNTLQAIAHGVRWVDSTITGMGRGAGNTKTEELILELDNKSNDYSYLIPILKIINKKFNIMKKEYNWGTNPYYFLAAKFSIHPTYIQKILSDNRFKEEDILSVIDYFKHEDSTKFLTDQLESAKSFYRGKPVGSISSKTIIRNREVLILGSGEKLAPYRKALEDLILRKKLLVIALNANSQVDEALIDYRIASNPVRLLADMEMHLSLTQPLITPASMLPNFLAEKFSNKNLIDYGIGTSTEGFEFHEKYGIIPSQLVLAYALAFVTSGNAKRIFLAGFEGYGLGDLRNKEVNELIEKFYESQSNIKLVSITPTEYKGLDSISIYGM